MRGHEITGLSLSEAAALVLKRQVSPLELTQACIARAEALDSTLNAFFTPTFDLALAEARAATEAIAAGEYRGPLHGIPFALKDLYETAGLRTTAGSPLRHQYVPDEDAHAVALLKRAGVVLLGKLNMHEWALGGTNINAFYPSPRNPWDPRRITGGSSGGAGAAVAAGLCFGALGSDTRGSIRIPAALCGVSGLKPTYGRVSLRGVVPLSWSLDHAGPLARTAADCAHILQAIAGWDPRDPTAAELPVPDYSADLEASVRGIRIGVARRFFFDEGAVAAEVSAAVLAAAEALASLGATVSEVAFPGHLEFEASSAFTAEAAAYHETRLREHPEGYSDPIRSRLQAAQQVTAMAYARERYAQLEMKLALRHVFDEVDLILTPTSPIVAPTFEEALGLPPTLLARNTSPHNLAGIPTISVPCGLSADGLPIGLSLAGRWWEEARVLGAAHAYQVATGWHERRPTVSQVEEAQP